MSARRGGSQSLWALFIGSVVAVATFAIGAFFSPFQFLGDPHAEVLATASMSLILFVIGQSFSNYFLLNDVSERADGTLDQMLRSLRDTRPFVSFNNALEAEQYVLSRVGECESVDNTHLRCAISLKARPQSVETKSTRATDAYETAFKACMERGLVYRDIVSSFLVETHADALHDWSQEKPPGVRKYYLRVSQIASPVCNFIILRYRGEGRNEVKSEVIFGWAPVSVMAKGYAFATTDRKLCDYFEGLFEEMWHVSAEVETAEPKRTKMPGSGNKRTKQPPTSTA